MYAVWVEVQVRPGKLRQFMTAIEENARRSVADEPGCYFFDVIELDRQEQRFAFYEIYRDRSAFAEEHRSTPHYAAWRSTAGEVIVPGTHVNTEGVRLFGATAVTGHETM
ncbi:antibiotic biosynthesis monooxygenase [Microbispora sp. NEAU-D428]|nr:antibiotic biosynthesis monooxygenase [Microbispora sitophila]